VGGTEHSIENAETIVGILVGMVREAGGLVAGNGT
jgi:hypothetical protein